MHRIFSISPFVLVFCFLNVLCQPKNKENSTESPEKVQEETTDAANQPERMVMISTEYGNIKVKLYNETPKHRDNFIKLAKEGFYDGTLFHRVINDFMIQGGDPDSKNAAAGAPLGNGGPGYTIPAEFNPKLYHKKGALAAARKGDQENPEKASSGSQFYIVQGKVFTEQEMKSMEKKRNNYYKNKLFGEWMERPENADYKERWIALTSDPIQPKENQPKMAALHQEVDSLVTKEFNEKGMKYEMQPEQLEAYTTTGGTPHLDMEYTVFGEVIEGLEVIDSIAAVETDQRARPKVDIEMKVKIIK